MRSILLVRHAQPLVNPGQQARVWELTPASRDAARACAAQLAGERPDLVVTSRERKARETGEIIAGVLGLDVLEDERLGEQGRDEVAFMDDRERFRIAVHQHFEESSSVVLGQESSLASAARFTRVVADLRIRMPPPRCPVLVSHGRVMAAFLASITGADAWTLWEDLRMPDTIAVDLGSGTIRRLVAQ